MPLTRIWERIVLGSLQDANDLAKANPLGINTAISLCAEPVRGKARGLNYLQFPIADNRPLPVGEFDRIIDAIAENVCWGKVLLHCNAGVVRSPIITAAWMDVCGYKGVDRALLEIAAVRPIISTENGALLSSVKKHLH